MGRERALHVAHLVLIPGIPYDPQALPEPLTYIRHNSIAKKKNYFNTLAALIRKPFIDACLLLKNYYVNSQ